MFEGLTVAMVTPFRQGELDLEATARLVDFMLEGGVEGLVVSGSTGEAATCSEEGWTGRIGSGSGFGVVSRSWRARGPIRHRTASSCLGSPRRSAWTG
jgi:hypothetical protein